VTRVPPFLRFFRRRPERGDDEAGESLDPRNYVDPAGPRFVRASAADGACTTLRFITFNLEFGERVERAIELFRESSELQAADVIAMQEMHEVAVERVADALGMGYVYYPATLHSKHERNFGNAIFSRWPIVDDRKHVLPHLARFRRTQRIAVSGTIEVAGVPVRVFSIHLATMLDNPASAQRAQVRTILEEAEPYERVIIAGDLNGYGVGHEFVRGGFAWPTRNIGATMRLWSVDHVFLRGMELTGSGTNVGVVRETRGASDHRPVWTDVMVCEDR
jgi:endonuclease/exonuclease/phosphatase family metal-dependent hydrolase